MIFQDHQLSAPSKYYNFSEGGRHQVLLVPSFNSVFAALGNSWISQHLNDPLSVSKVDSLSAQCFKLLWDLTDMKQLWSHLAVSGHFYTDP